MWGATVLTLALTKKRDTPSREVLAVIAVTQSLTLDQNINDTHRKTAAARTEQRHPPGPAPDLPRQRHRANSLPVLLATPSDHTRNSHDLRDHLGTRRRPNDLSCCRMRSVPRDSGSAGESRGPVQARVRLHARKD